MITLEPEFLTEINKFDNIYIESSGGFHSSSTALLFFEAEYENIFLLHNDTKLQYKECLDNIQKIVKITDYPLILKQPNLKKKKISQIMKESFANIEKAKTQCNKHNYRDSFICCKILKQERNYKWNKDFLLDNSIVISSITPFESYNRQMRLFELKKKDTYIRYHKTQKTFKGYPYRDLLQGNRIFSRHLFDEQFKDILRTYDLNIKHSGCRICPIRILFPEMLEKNDCSIKYAKIFT